MNRKFLANLRIALRALRVNKMRSALTMLGIVIGVAAVIAMVAIGTGATKSIQEQIASIGSNLIIVMSGSLTSGGMRMGSGMAMTLTESDARAIGHECPAVKAASPSMRGGAQVVFGNSNWGTSISGVTPDYLGIRDIKIAEGNAFTDQDVAAAAKVCLLGKTVAENLFGTADPIGKSIRSRRSPSRSSASWNLRGSRRRARIRMTSSSCRSRPPRSASWASRQPMPTRSARSWSRGLTAKV